jgi:hypothetical protein
MAENEQLQQLLDAVKIIIDPNEPGYLYVIIAWVAEQDMERQKDEIKQKFLQKMVKGQFINVAKEKAKE